MGLRFQRVIIHNGIVEAADGRHISWRETEDLHLQPHTQVENELEMMLGSEVSKPVPSDKPLPHGHIS